jgi:hypothetical protein
LIFRQFILNLEKKIIPTSATIDNMKKLSFILFSLYAFVFFIFSCSLPKTYVEINEIGTYPHLLFKPLPIKVGAYYGSDFSKFEIIRRENKSFHWGSVPNGKICPLDPDIIKIGKANIALFDYIFSHVFQQVTIIQHLPKKPENIADIDIIIESNVKDYSSYIKRGSIANKYHQFLTYVITFYSPNGEPMGSWTIEGKASFSYSLVLPGTLTKEGINIAMREVAVKFITGFCKQGKIKKLFDKQCNQ